MPVAVLALNPSLVNTVQWSVASQTPRLQVEGLFHPKESDTCLFSCFRSSGIGVGCMSTVLQKSDDTVETAIRGYELGDGISCGAAHTITARKALINIGSRWNFMVLHS